MHLVDRNGICVIARDGKPACVVLSLSSNPALIELIYATVAVAAARRRDQGGVVSLADRIFGTRDHTDQWMASKIWSLGGKRPVDLLGTDEGVNEVRNVLGRIEHGIFA